MNDKKPFVSIVIPVFNESKSILSLYKEICVALENYDKIFEIIFVDDCSTDTSKEEIENICRKDKRVKGIHMLKNTKKGGALCAGFQMALSEIVITLDADLQDDPNEVVRLLSELEKGADVVIGWKKNRKDPLIKCLASCVINLLTSMCLKQKFHDMNTGLKGYRSAIVKNINIPGSMYRFVPHIIANQGYDVREIAVHHRCRKYGESKFGLTHRLRGVLDLIALTFVFKFGNRPFHLFGSIGFFVFGLGVAMGAYLINVQLRGESISGRPLLSLCAIFILLGMQIISIGLIGELIIRYIPGEKELHLEKYRILNE